MILFPPRLDKDIAENDPVRIVDSVIDDLRLDDFKKLYKEKGRSPYHPKMMLKAIIYGYMNNLYSCRKIESALKRDVHFIWLAGYEQPDFNTINRFRNRVKDEINKVFTQLVLILAERGFITLDVEYIDGTKIESKANKYTFVWRKNAERNRAKLQEKIKVLLGQIDDAIAQENREVDSGAPAFTSAELANIAEDLNQALANAPAPTTKEEEKSRKERHQQIKQLKEHAEKLGEYDCQLAIMGNRNSYSKTDHDATFMRMKEDAMNNGQTKPGYNLQISTEKQFITDFGLFQSPGDPFTMIPFLQSFHDRYGKYPQTAVADSGYGSEENYRFMDESNIDAYVKYNMFHKEQRPHYEPDPFSPMEMFYNEEEDYCVCPMGQHMTRIGTTTSQTESGYEAERGQYKAQRCEGCPLAWGCFKTKGSKATEDDKVKKDSKTTKRDRDSTGNRIIEVNHRLKEYRRKARERLVSEEGLKHRGRRSIEPEAVFGQMKYDMAYKRFRHVMLDKVTMDFAFFAIAFNIKKMCSKMAKSEKNGGNTPHYRRFIFVFPITVDENRQFWQNTQTSAA
jgi:transposase